MTDNNTFDPSLIERKNTELQEKIAEYNAILVHLIIAMQSDVDNPDTPAPNDTLIEFGETLLLARSAGKEFLRLLTKMPKLSEQRQ